MRAAAVSVCLDRMTQTERMLSDIDRSISAPTPSLNDMSSLVTLQPGNDEEEEEESYVPIIHDLVAQNHRLKQEVLRWKLEFVYNRVRHGFTPNLTRQEWITPSMEDVFSAQDEMMTDPGAPWEYEGMRRVMQEQAQEEAERVKRRGLLTTPTQLQSTMDNSPNKQSRSRAAKVTNGTGHFLNETSASKMKKREKSNSPGPTGVKGGNKSKGNSLGAGNNVHEKSVKGGKTEAPSGSGRKVSPECRKAPLLPIVPADEPHVGRLDLRVGHIVEASLHPDASTLYIEKIDVGEENPRTIISGLVRHVPLAQMQDRHVVVLCNLKPAKMRGVTSEGMVMCASGSETVEILSPPKGSVAGDLVIVEGYRRQPDAQLNPKKKVLDSILPDLKTDENCVATYKGTPLQVPDKGLVKAPTLTHTHIR